MLILHTLMLLTGGKQQYKGQTKENCKQLDRSHRILQYCKLLYKPVHEINCANNVIFICCQVTIKSDVKREKVYVN